MARHAAFDLTEVGEVITRIDKHTTLLERDVLSLLEEEIERQEHQQTQNKALHDESARLRKDLDSMRSEMLQLKRSLDLLASLMRSSVKRDELERFKEEGERFGPDILSRAELRRTLDEFEEEQRAKLGLSKKRVQ